MTDVWSKASAQNAADAAPQAGNGQGAQHAGQAANPVADMANPFAKSSEVTGQGGGQFDPFVPSSYLEGRMVIMVPKEFHKDVPKKEEFGGGVQDEWRYDLIILDGGPFSFTYKERASKDAEPVEKTFEVKEFPAVFRGQIARAGQLIGALNGANRDGKFLYGVFSKVPVMQDLRAGKTIEKLHAEIAQWRQDVAAGKPGTTPNMPRHTFNLDDRPQVLTPERVNLAAAWWEKEKASRLATAS